MPRPGPRPYECVRRAWHSDRHKPMRGSIIQQIFRVVYETHSAATKKNKEWQEKLPIVVIKAEEIMYSKANSEAEYMNLDTLWDRANDAINTIIRRDESSETGGEFLPPCVEAALNLGCIPVRASRSQRHCNPRTYLSPRVQEPLPVPSRVLDKTNDGQCPQLSPFHSGNQLNISRAATTVNSVFSVSECNHHQTHNGNSIAPWSYPLPYTNYPPGCNQFMTNETNRPLNLGSIYPLYYGNQYQVEESQLVSQVPENTRPNTIFIGKPVCTSIAESAEIGALQNFFSSSGAEIPSKRNTQAYPEKSHDKPSGVHCDLSLRLGLFSESSMRAERSLAQETETIGSSSFQPRSKFSDFSPQKNREFCFFPGQGIDNPLESCSSRWFTEGEDQNLEETFRKRKAPFSDNVEDRQFCWHPEFSSD